MNFKENLIGFGHIGIPTNDIAVTVAFYEKLGFKTALRTVNEEAGEQVAFLKLNSLMIETYENHEASMLHGSLDHIAIDVKDIDSVLAYINENGLNNTGDSIHFLPFWEKGVKYFKIEGPNREIIEFSQVL